MNLEEILDENLKTILSEIKFSKHPIWLVKELGEKDWAYVNDSTDMEEALKYFNQSYGRLKDGDYQLILRKNKNQSNGQLNRKFTKGVAASTNGGAVGSVSNIGSQQWGIGQVINEMEQRFDLRLKNDRLERENKELRKEIDKLKNEPEISGTTEVLKTLDPYIQHFLNHHYPLSKGAAVGTLTANKGDEVPASDENLTEEQLTRLWSICQRFAVVFETSDFDALLTCFEKLAAKAETMPAVVKTMIL